MNRFASIARVARNASTLCRTQILSQTQPIKYMIPMSKCQYSSVDRKFSDVLSKEIQGEKKNAMKCSPPTGFSVSKSDGAEVELTREYPDGVVAHITFNL